MPLLLLQVPSPPPAPRSPVVPSPISKSVTMDSGADFTYSATDLNKSEQHADVAATKGDQSPNCLLPPLVPSHSPARHRQLQQQQQQQTTMPCSLAAVDVHSSLPSCLTTCPRNESSKMSTRTRLGLLFDKKARSPKVMSTSAASVTSTTSPSSRCRGLRLLVGAS